MRWSALRNNKGQVTPFLMLLLGVLLLAIVATMLIGEAAYNKIRLSNVADGALISSASGYSRSLNQLRQIKLAMELNHFAMQMTLLFVPRGGIGLPDNSYRGCSTCGGWVIPLWCGKGCPFTYPSFTQAYIRAGQVFEQAEDIAKNMAKDLRSGLIDGVFSGALTDEPKPFLEAEVSRDASSGRVIGFDFDSYAIRESRSTLILRAFKAADYDGWYLNNTLSYYYSKHKEKALSLIDNQGKPIDPLNYIATMVPPSVFPAPDGSGTEAYLTMTMHGVPTAVTVEAVPKILIYIWGKCAGWPTPVCIPLPGIIPNKYSSLRINVQADEGDGYHFGMKVAKSVPYKVIFFERQLETVHKNKVWIRGGLSQGWEPKLEEYDYAD